MVAYSTSEAARKLGITQAALSKYIKAGKIPTPKKVRIGRLTIHSWTERELKHLRKLLPKIANGRKTRYQKLRERQQPPARASVPHKKKQSKKK